MATLMISFETEKDLLEQAMKRLEVIIPARDSGTLLSHVLLSVTSKNVSITASDMESTVRIFIPAEGTQEGELIVRAKKLSEIATALKSKRFVFSAKEEEIHESDNDGKTPEDTEKRYQISIQGEEKSSVKYRMPGGFRFHFPEISMISEDKLFKLPSALLLEMINKTFYSVSQEENRYIYSGLHISSNENQLTVVGTDGRRLSAVTRKLPQPVELTGEGEEAYDIVVYSKAIKELKNLLVTQEEVQVGVEQKNIFFRVGDAELSSRLLEGKFPDYEKVVPQEKNISVQLERRALLHAFEEVMVMTEEPSRQVRMSLQNGRLLLEANTVDIGESEKAIPIEYTGDELNICFNGTYVQDILRNINPNDVLVSIENENKPIMIHDPDDPDFISLVMPMRA